MTGIFRSLWKPIPGPGAWPSATLPRDDAPSRTKAATVKLLARHRMLYGFPEGISTPCRVQAMAIPCLELPACFPGRETAGTPELAPKTERHLVYESLAQALPLFQRQNES